MVQAYFKIQSVEKLNASTYSFVIDCPVLAKGKLVWAVCQYSMRRKNLTPPDFDFRN